MKVGDLTISSSVWPTYHPLSRHLHCGTTPCVVSGRVQSLKELRSPCGVPQNTCIINHTCVASILTCGVPRPCRRTDMSSYSFRRPITQISANWRSTFAVSCCESKPRQTFRRMKINLVNITLNVYSYVTVSHSRGQLSPARRGDPGFGGGGQNAGVLPSPSLSSLPFRFIPFLSPLFSSPCSFSILLLLLLPSPYTPLRPLPQSSKGSGGLLWALLQRFSDTSDNEVSQKRQKVVRCSTLSSEVWNM